MSGSSSLSHMSNFFFYFVEHMFLLSAKSSVEFHSFPFSQLYAAPSYKKAEMVQSDFLEFACCSSCEPYTFTPCFSAFTVYL